MNEGINAAFIQLQPLCNSIVTNPTQENLTELPKLFKIVSKHVLQQLHEYIIFPLYLQLQNNSHQNDFKRQLIDIINELLGVVKIKSANLFVQLCAGISNQVIDKSTLTLFPNVDEELKLSAMCCLKSLYSALSSDLMLDIYTKKYAVYFPQSVYLCTQIAKLERMRNLRLTAIQCLMTICYVHDEADFTDVVFRKDVAEIISFLLPGILIALRDVALGDEKQGHKITALAIKAFNRIVVLHMQDYNAPVETQMVYKFTLSKPRVSEEKLEDKQAKDKENIMERITKDNLTPDWYKMTAEKLETLIKSLMPLQSHYNEKVRLELSDFCKQIVIQCSKYMENSLTYCIEMLISLSEDDDTRVSEHARTTLTSISKQNFNSLFLEISADNFYNVISRLPRIIDGTNVLEQLSTLNLLVGYLRMLGPSNILRVLQSVDHLKRLIQALILVSQIEVTNVTIFEEYAVRDFDSISNSSVTWKHFKYIEDKLLYSKLQTAFRLLSESDAVEIIVDCLSDLFLTDYEQRNEIIFLLNEVIAVRSDDEKRVRLINIVLEMYIEEENWYLSTNGQSLALVEVHKNIIQMCLLVEGVGNMSEALGIHFKGFLLKTFYLVLERAGNAQPLLSAAGLSALVKIAKFCGYTSVTDLIVQNTDYYSFHVVRRLKRLELNTNVLNVLDVIMKYSDAEVLPSIMDIINEVLIYSVDKFQEHNTTSFLKIFYSFVENLKRWLNIKIQHETKLEHLLKDYKKQMDVLYAIYDTSFDDDIMTKSAKEMYDEDMMKSEEEVNNYDMDEEPKKKIPPNIKLTVDVLKRSLHFLPSKNRERKLLVLNILNEGIEIINSWENELLPIVHLIWSPLVDRFNEQENPLEINRSFVLLSTLAKYSKDFIRSRTSKAVFPQICAILKKLSKESYLKDRGSAYRYTQEYKLQLTVLSNLASLISDLEMTSKDVEFASNAVLPYLSNKQPLPLQECIVSFYKTLATYDFDSVWLCLINFWHSTAQNNQEYRKNTEAILKVMDLIHW